MTQGPGEVELAAVQRACAAWFAYWRDPLNRHDCEVCEGTRTDNYELCSACGGDGVVDTGTIEAAMQKVVAAVLHTGTFG